MKWALFFWIYAATSSGGNVVINQEFETQEKCEIVGRWMVEKAKESVPESTSKYNTRKNDIDYACFATK